MNYIYDLKAIKEELQSNQLTYKNYLKYYKLGFVLRDKEFFEILSKAVPSDLDESTEERFYELEAKLKMNLMLKY